MRQKEERVKVLICERHFNNCSLKLWSLFNEHLITQWTQPKKNTLNNVLPLYCFSDAGRKHKSALK